MKHTKLMAIVSLLLLGVSGATAQSLGDYARTARKNKSGTSAASRHYDNDNLPTDQQLSVVGPPATADAAAAAATATASPAAAAATNPATAKADRQKAADEWKTKLDKQKDKIAALNHELDLDQREYRLKAATFYGDAGERLRNAAQWDKEDTQYKSDIESKQKALDAARQELDELQEQARKAGIAEKDKDSDKDSDKDKGK
jgi:hypothetical protein